MVPFRPSSIDEYLATVPSEEARTRLETLRSIVLEMVPDAEELISYQIPSFKYHGMLVGFAAYKHFCSLYPLNGHTIKQFESELSDYKTSKAAIQFPHNKPIPEELVRRIVAKRVEENIANNKESKER